MTLPWDELTPDQPEIAPPPVPAAPVEPVVPPRPPPVPAPPPPAALDADIAALGKDILNEAFGYARDSIKAITAGQTVDILHPTVTAETAAGRELVVADAKSRSWRTLIQGLAFDVMAAIVAAVAMLSGADPFVKETWLAFGVLLLKSVVSAAIAFLMRLRIQPTIKLETERIPVMPVPQPQSERNQP